MNGSYYFKRVALYVVATLCTGVILSASDSVRPPYVGWKTELAAGAFVVVTIRLVMWRPLQTGTQQPEGDR